MPNLDAAEQETKPQDLAKAIASLRHIDPQKLTEAEKTRKSAEIKAARAVLRAAEQSGALALKREIEAIDKAGEKDDFFKLVATAMLWQIARLEEAEHIATVWASTRLDTHYDYVFYSTFQAAQTQDPRALQMLKACLKDKKGSVFLDRHFLDVKWPQTHEFVWGTFGPKGLPALDELLGTSKDPVEWVSAMALVGQAQYLPALSKIRKLAADKDDEVRGAAIQMLGVFGHPQDYDFLVSGLSAKDPKEASSHAYALAAYGDLRAVAPLIPLLKSPDEALRHGVFAALCCLPTPAGLEAIKSHADTAKAADEKNTVGEAVAAVLKEINLTWEAYAAKPPDEKAAVLAGLRQKAEEPYKLKPDDQQLTHAQLLEAAQGWKQRRSRVGGDYTWVRERHILAAATPEDIDLLLDVKAFVYRRLSDECLSEIRFFDGLVARLGRSRYRAVAGVCEKVEAKTP
jgi:HEAT repeat protein